MSTHSNLTTGAHAMSDAAAAYLDALRAIGANLVIVSHVLALHFGIKGLFPFGGLGVTIFFLLSGFLIMQSLLNRTSSNTPQLPGFLADRAARILTPYVPALVLIAIMNLIFIDGSYSRDGLNNGMLAFVGNLLLLQDHSAFQFLELLGIDLAWRIRPYNSAEPFWTVAIEMWIYVAAGLFFFCAVQRERIGRGWLTVLILVSFPVVVWNAAAGGGKSLSLIWLMGAMIGLIFHRWRAQGYPNAAIIATTMIGFGSLALIGRVGKVGFYPYDFQTATLVAIVLFGVLARLFTVRHLPSKWQRALELAASYSYSLYLLHNTILIAVLELFPATDPRARAIVAVVLAHACSYLFYLAFERHYRTVAAWMRPYFAAVLHRDSAARITDATLSTSEPAPNLAVRKP
ncbi:MAG: acyltransferase [Steroidobacteraceae bacterium]